MRKSAAPKYGQARIDMIRVDECGTEFVLNLLFWCNFLFSSFHFFCIDFSPLLHSPPPCLGMEISARHPTPFHTPSTNIENCTLISNTFLFKLGPGGGG